MRAGLSQEELAERAGISTRSVSDIERGRQLRPFPGTVRRLAEGLGLDAEEQGPFIESFLGLRSSPPRGSSIVDRPSLPPPEEPQTRFGAITEPIFRASLSSPVVEERRLATALFCELAGLTSLPELDPEDVRDIQEAYLSAVRSQIERYGGVLETYPGGTIMGLFGIPAAHEDDPERAVLCALGIRDAVDAVAAEVGNQIGVYLEEPPEVRIGVDTGEIVSGPKGMWGWQNIAVSGDAVNTAERLQASAAPAEILVGAETVRLSRSRIMYGPVRDLMLKGRTSAIRVFPALTLNRTADDLWQAVHEVLPAAPFVGREREMAALTDLWDRARSGAGQLVSIVGEPGVGKSRIIAEFIPGVAGGASSWDRVSATSDAAVRVVQGRCLSYRQGVSLWLVADVLRSIFSIRQDDSLHTIRERLDVAVPNLLAAEGRETHLEAMDVLGEVLGLAPSESTVTNAGPEVRRNALVRDLRRVLAALSECKPTIMVLQDLHWIDTASSEVLAQVAVEIPRLRMLVLVAQRDVSTAPWGHFEWPERLDVGPLVEAQASTLAVSVLGGVPLSETLERYLAERAGGNPFFIEEVARSLKESGALRKEAGCLHLVSAVAQRLPNTLAEVLQARLDRLDPEVKWVAQAGSVIGRSFAVPLLADVVGEPSLTLEPRLEALRRAEIAFPNGDPVGPRTRDLEYSFKHAMMREAAYNTLVRKRRNEFHLKIARAIAAQYPSPDYIETVAYHYSRTNVDAEAVPWLERAGDRAATVYSNDAAIDYFKDALDRLHRAGGSGRDRGRLLEKLGATLSTAGENDEAITVLDEATDAYRDLGDLESAARATALCLEPLLLSAGPVEAIDRCRTMLNALEGTADSRAIAKLNMFLGRALMTQADNEGALTSAKVASQVARRIDDSRLLGEARALEGWILVNESPEEACSVMEAALPLVERGGDLRVLARTLRMIVRFAPSFGSRELARVERAALVAEQTGNPATICQTFGQLSVSLVGHGYWKLARRYAEQALAVAGTRGQWLETQPPLGALGWLNVWEGNWDEASRYLERGLIEAREAGDKADWTGGHIAFLSELDILRGLPAAAAERLEALIKERGSDSVDPTSLGYLAWAYADAGDVDQLPRALQLARRAMERSRAWGNHWPGWVPPREGIPWALGIVLARIGEEDEARRSFDEALRLARAGVCPYYEARSLAQLGILDARQGARAAAQNRFTDALSIFERLGAKKDVEKLQALLAGTDIDRSSAKDPPILTV